MKYRFRATRTFWRSLQDLPAAQQQSARAAFVIFRSNPFDARLCSHKIHRLSARYGRTIYAAVIEGDLRTVFYIDHHVVVTVDIGSHSVYRA
ncbi:MAG: hypothetical protein M3Q89_13150 [Verrucomicrobiota bacterium]|nr:hypothetical protein [Verrucomicrobiota bacterium]